MSIAFLLDRCDSCLDAREARLRQQPQDFSVEDLDRKLVLKYAAAILIALFISRFVAGLDLRLAMAMFYTGPIIILIGLTTAAAQQKNERSRHVLVIAMIVWLANGLLVLVSGGFDAFWHYLPMIVMYVLIGLFATVLSFAFVRSAKS